MQVTLEKIVSLCKRRGFVYPASEIYGGLNGIYDFGPLGTQLRHNIQKEWYMAMMTSRHEVLMIDGAILGPEAMWKASGHLEGFHDPMIDCTNCKKRYRADDISIKKACPSCGISAWTDVRQFNMMFKTALGALEENASDAYLRPETAQAIFTNFKNVMSSNRVKIPFGIGQVGKAFRNEITPKQFLFRMREFEQMELEFFCKEADTSTFFDEWVEKRMAFHKSLVIQPDKLRLRSHEQDELAHYAKACTDVEYEFPFGWKELEGIANRTDFDLSAHSKHSGKDLAVFDEESKTSYTPHVIECSVGVDRLFLTLLCDAYAEDDLGGETRTVLRFKPHIAPVQAAILPLSKQLSEASEKLAQDLRMKGYRVQFDVAGSIGKRYRRQDEIGTPICFTYDFESKDDNKVTARNRDTLKQERIEISEVPTYLAQILTGKGA